MSLCIIEEILKNMPRREHTVTHICKPGMSNCVLISPPLKKPFGSVELGWTGYPMCLLSGFFFSAVLCSALLCLTISSLLYGQNFVSSVLWN